MLNTKELRDWMIKQNIQFDEDENMFYIQDQIYISKCSSSGFEVEENAIFYGQKDMQLLLNIIDYVETPCYERDEQQYYLTLPGIGDITKECYLNRSMSGGYFFGTSEYVDEFQVTFTEEEIENFTFPITNLIRIKREDLE